MPKEFESKKGSRDREGRDNEAGERFSGSSEYFGREAELATERLRKGCAEASKRLFDFAGEKLSFSSKGQKDVPEAKRDVFPVSSRLDGLRSSSFRLSVEGTVLG